MYVLPATRTWVEVVRGYVALTKPRIIELLLVTTIPTMVVAYGAIPPARLILLTVLGGTLAAGGANTFNMVLDRDIDAVMERTKNRPLVQGVMSPRAAVVFAVVLELAAFALLALWVNQLSAWLALSATAFYVVIYTMWLKRRSKQNIVIGGAAGATAPRRGCTMRISCCARGLRALPIACSTSRAVSTRRSISARAPTSWPSSTRRATTACPRCRRSINSPCGRTSRRSWRWCRSRIREA